MKFTSVHVNFNSLNLEVKSSDLKFTYLYVIFNALNLEVTSPDLKYTSQYVVFLFSVFEKKMTEFEF